MAFHIYKNGTICLWLNMPLLNKDESKSLISLQEICYILLNHMISLQEIWYRYLGDKIKIWAPEWKEWSCRPFKETEKCVGIKNVVRRGIVNLPQLKERMKPRAEPTLHWWRKKRRKDNPIKQSLLRKWNWPILSGLYSQLGPLTNSAHRSRTNSARS